MENANSDDPGKKRLLLNISSINNNNNSNRFSSLFSPMAHHSSSPDYNTVLSLCVDPAVLQYQNLKLVQQLDAQKHELHDLEAKIKELKDKHALYDDMLITLSQLWNQVTYITDALILLGARAGLGESALQILNCAESSRGSIPSCRADVVSLCRLLGKDSIQSDGNYDLWLLLKMHLPCVIHLHKIHSQPFTIRVSSDLLIQLCKIDDLMKDEASNLREVTEMLHLKHKEYADGLQTYASNHSVDQSEIKHIPASSLECRNGVLQSINRFSAGRQGFYSAKG